MQHGRIEHFTDVQEITYENVGEIVRKAMSAHNNNVAKMDFLLEYEAGMQPLRRTKTYRKEIDCKCVDNVANEIAEFKQNYNWGNPITLVMREKSEDEKSDLSQAVIALNKCYEAQGYKAKQQELARFIEIVGVGYTFVDINTDYEEGDSYFTVDVLDPRSTFVVKSSYYLDKRPMLGVTFYQDVNGKKHYTCFSRDGRYELNGSFEHDEKSGELNPLKMIPIVEWLRAYDRMGCFERQISEMDNLNLLISDFTNDVDQNTQVIWHCNDVEFPIEVTTTDDGQKVEKIKRPATNDWLQTYTSQDGKTPFVKPMAIEYDYTGMLNNIITRRALILQKCDVPSRNDNSGGSTGIAMSDATGWTQAEIAATKQDQLKEHCKMEEVKVVLRAIAKSSHVKPDNVLRKIHAVDIKPSIKRQKTYEMTTKINAYATGVSHGINPTDMLYAINLFDDPQQVAENSKETTRKYLESIFDKTNSPVGGEGEKSPNADRLSPDQSDQIENSPNIDGMKTN